MEKVAVPRPLHGNLHETLCFRGRLVTLVRTLRLVTKLHASGPRLSDFAGRGSAEADMSLAPVARDLVRVVVRPIETLDVVSTIIEEVHLLLGDVHGWVCIF